ncbi:MAG TPA: hypothetical protein VG269_12405 [Tepidisphaeraceae bacterium]|jgi:acid stress-induced BolA-like protein IbaG/YrbA|nr:hypothetical protein [Tepidisphaeraceae bacterium]
MTKAKLRAILVRELLLSAPEFHLKDISGRLSGSIVSESFKGMRDNARQEMIWDVLHEALGPKSVKSVEMLPAYTPDEWEPDLCDAAVAAPGSCRHRRAGGGVTNPPPHKQ